MAEDDDSVPTREELLQARAELLRGGLLTFVLTSNDAPLGAPFVDHALVLSCLLLSAGS